MKYLSLIFVTFALTACASCSKSDSSGSSSVAPTNLTVSATVSTNNSGNVTFAASATNAVSYDYDFGNGVFQTSTTGGLTYRYLTSGTYTVNVIAKGSGGQVISKSVQVTINVTLSLLWSEEFSVDGSPDPTKWGYDLGTGSGGWGNNELEYYTSRPENAIVQGGILKIKAIKESYNGSAYTSARLLSKNKFSFKYGKVDISAKLPTGAGTWPAIWMLGNTIDTDGWPACGEIDIMEGRGSEPNKIFGTLHYPGHSGSNGNGNTTMISNASTQFHKYSMEWSAAAIKLSVDDVVYQTVPNSANIPFNANFFFILNVAMGGNFAGAVDPAFTSSTMEIDYIRVYQ